MTNPFPKLLRKAAPRDLKSGSTAYWLHDDSRVSRMIIEPGKYETIQDKFRKWILDSIKAGRLWVKINKDSIIPKQ